MKEVAHKIMITSKITVILEIDFNFFYFHKVKFLIRAREKFKFCITLK